MTELCPTCEYTLTDIGRLVRRWCRSCLNAQVHAARAALHTCWCSEHPEPHRHDP